MLPDGHPIEGVGIPPDIRVEVLKTTYATADPTLEKGLEVLRRRSRRQSIDEPRLRVRP